jgi:acyl dehydratase
MPLDPALVGHETARQTYTVTAADIARFADALGDSNPLFRDTGHAASAGFPDVLATPTFVTRFRVPFGDIGLDPNRMQVLHAEQQYEYSRPLHAGQQVVAWHRLASLRSSARAGGMSILTLEMPGEDPSGAPLFMGQAVVIVREGAQESQGSERQRAAKPADAPEGKPIGPLVKAVSQPQINAYADASGDHNPIHINAEAARAVGLDGTIAHGMLSMGFLGQLVTDWLAAQPTTGGWVSRLRVRFQAMVRPGDTLTCQGVLTEGAEAGHQAVAVWAQNQHGERVTFGEAEVVLPSSR